jgi:ferredoxin--NADP+ reductase
MDHTTGTAALTPKNIAALRAEHYNASLIKVIEIHSDLRILRVRADDHSPGFEPGQYTTLGLGSWEPRVTGVDEEPLTAESQHRLLRRAYSFSCPMLDEAGQLLPPSRCDFLEFYVVLVRHGGVHPPGLTPRLFALAEGARLYTGHKSTGHYTLHDLDPTADVVFIATGTGEAPHTAMITHLLDQGHRRRLVCVTCVRRQSDLGYLATFRRLEQEFDNLRYLTLTTREPVNFDRSHPGYVGKRYLQEYLESGDLERDGEIRLNPDTCHVYLCGNPAMIGVPHRGASGQDRYPKPRGMIELLESRGFQTDEPHRPGNIHYEKYW